MIQQQIIWVLILKMARPPLQRALQVAAICVVYSQVIEACLDDTACPTSKSCCNGICRYSCTCESSADCDWDEKCCANRQCADGFELCSQPLPVYFIAIGTCSVISVTFLCLLFICYWARCCPWYKRRIARRRRHQSGWDATVHRPQFATLSSTNTTQELHFPAAPQSLNFPPPPYLPPLTGNPAKYSSYTVQRMSTSMYHPAPYTTKTY